MIDRAFLGVGKGLELCEDGVRKYQCSNLVQMLIESTNVQPNTKASLLPPRSSTAGKPLLGVVVIYS